MNKQGFANSVAPYFFAAIESPFFGRLRICFLYVPLAARSRQSDAPRKRCVGKRCRGFLVRPSPADTAGRAGGSPASSASRGEDFPPARKKPRRAGLSLRAGRGFLNFSLDLVEVEVVLVLLGLFRLGGLVHHVAGGGAAQKRRAYLFFQRVVHIGVLL